MTFKPGDKKLENSGRKKGTPNKKTWIVTRKLEEQGFDVIEELVKVFREADIETKASIGIKLLEYSCPKPKQLDYFIYEDRANFKTIHEDIGGGIYVSRTVPNTEDDDAMD